MGCIVDFLRVDNNCRSCSVCLQFRRIGVVDVESNVLGKCAHASQVALEKNFPLIISTCVTPLIAESDVP